jgi:hypothetical protein
MDQATRRLRARSKVLAGKRGELPEAETKGLGRRNRRHDTFPLKICDHIEGGQMFYFKKRVERPNGRTELVNGGFRKGGQRCQQTAVVGTKCLEHIGGGE